MTIHCGFFESTERMDLSDTPATYEIAGAVDDGRYSLLVTSDRVVHLCRNADASVDGGLRIAADEIVLVSMFGGDTLSFVQGTGEADGGSIWIGRTDQS